MLAIVFSPMGLLFMLIRSQSVQTVSASPQGTGSVVTVRGTTRKPTVDSVRAYIDSLAVRPDPPAAIDAGAAV